MVNLGKDILIFSYFIFVNTILFCQVVLSLDLIPDTKGEDKDLFYQSQRYYDPKLSRFINPDTVIPDPARTQAFNRYSYVYNDPLQYNDPSGHVPHRADDPSWLKNIVNSGIEAVQGIDQSLYATFSAGAEAFTLDIKQDPIGSLFFFFGATKGTGKGGGKAPKNPFGGPAKEVTKAPLPRARKSTAIQVSEPVQQVESNVLTRSDVAIIYDEVTKIAHSANMNRVDPEELAQIVSLRILETMAHESVTVAYWERRMTFRAYVRLATLNSYRIEVAIQNSFVGIPISDFVVPETIVDSMMQIPAPSPSDLLNARVYQDDIFHIIGARVQKIIAQGGDRGRVIDLAWNQNLDYYQIADQTGLSPSSVRNRVTRLRHELASLVDLSLRSESTIKPSDIRSPAGD